jgi:hypothetical protein
LQLTEAQANMVSLNTKKSLLLLKLKAIPAVHQVLVYSVELRGAEKREDKEEGFFCAFTNRM